MNDREYLQAKQVHQRLLEVARTERLIKAGRGNEAGLSLGDRLLILVGDRLISLGQGLKSRSRRYTLNEECA